MLLGAGSREKIQEEAMVLVRQQVRGRRECDLCKELNKTENG